MNVFSFLLFSFSFPFIFHKISPRPSVCLTACLSVCLSLSLSFSLSLPLSVSFSLSVCLSLSVFRGLHPNDNRGVGDLLLPPSLSQAPSAAHQRRRHTRKWEQHSRGRTQTNRQHFDCESTRTDTDTHTGADTDTDTHTGTDKHTDTDTDTHRDTDTRTDTARQSLLLLLLLVGFTEE